MATIEVSDSLLPPGWLRDYDDVTGRFYFFNKVSEHTQWELPLYPASDVPPQRTQHPLRPPLTRRHNPPQLQEEDEGLKEWEIVQEEKETQVFQGQTQQQPTKKEGEEGSEDLLTSFSDSVSGHFSPQEEKKAGSVTFFFNMSSQNGWESTSEIFQKWCVIEEATLFFLPSSDSAASLVEFTLPLVFFPSLSLRTTNNSDLRWR